MKITELRMLKKKLHRFWAVNARSLKEKDATTEDTLVSRNIDFAVISEANIMMLYEKK